MAEFINQLAELIAFVQSVESGSFSAAARLLETTPSAVSKRVAKLEDCLGVRLLQRTTRSLSLTTDGAAYYERIACVLSELEEANDFIMSQRKPRGKLRITAPLDFGRWLLVQCVPNFLAQYPEIQVDLRLSDHFVDLVEQGIDVAIRLGTLEDSSLIRRHLGQTRFVLCASPNYLNMHGTPVTPQDLVNHNCLRYISGGHPAPWSLVVNGALQTVPVSGTFDSDNGDALRLAALAGLGITRLLSFQVEADVRSKRLQLLLENQLPPGPVVQAIFTHQRHLSPRVQVFLEFLDSHSVNVLR